MVGVDFGLQFSGPFCPCWSGDGAWSADMRAVEKSRKASWGSPHGRAARNSRARAMFGEPQGRTTFRKRKGPRTKPNHGPKATQAAIGTRRPITEPTAAPKTRPAYHDKGATGRSMRGKKPNPPQQKSRGGLTLPQLDTLDPRPSQRRRDQGDTVFNAGAYGPEFALVTPPGASALRDA